MLDSFVHVPLAEEVGTIRSLLTELDEFTRQEILITKTLVADFELGSLPSITCDKKNGLGNDRCSEAPCHASRFCYALFFALFFLIFVNENTDLACFTRTREACSNSDIDLDSTTFFNDGFRTVRWNSKRRGNLKD